MCKLNQEEFERELIEVHQMQSYSGNYVHMANFIIAKLFAMGITPTRDKIGNIYATKGQAEFFPTMVCHIDTVHRYVKTYEVVQFKHKLFAIDRLDCTRLGIGGDDKVGIFITLQMLRKFDNFKAVFFVDEEIGCIGSSHCYMEFFKDSSFVLQCDRKGAYDFVNNISWTNLYSKDFSNAIKPILTKYKRKEVDGGMTDVEQIANSTDLCVANMSCGYYAPHSDNEWVNINDVKNTHDMCVEMFEQLSNKQWTISKSERNDSTGRSAYGGYYGRYNRDFADNVYRKYGGGAERSDAFDTRREEEFDFDNRNALVGTTPKIITDCVYCGGIHVEYDEFDESVYCFTCQEAMDIDEYREWKGLMDNHDFRNNLSAALTQAEDDYERDHTGHANEQEALESQVEQKNNFLTSGETVKKPTRRGKNSGKNKAEAKPQQKKSKYFNKKQ